MEKPACDVMYVKFINLAKVLRSLLAARDEAVRQKFTALLTPELSRWLENPEMEDRWLPLLDISRVIEKSAPLFFPGEAMPIRRLAEETMHNPNRFGGMRVMVQGIGTQQMLQLMIEMWVKYFSHGQASVVKTEQGAEIIIQGVKAIPPAFLEYVSGYIQAGVDLVADQPMRVLAPAPIENGWRWEIRQ